MKLALITSFISTNKAAYAVAAKVFTSIMAQDFTQTLADAGILTQDVKTFAVILSPPKSCLKSANAYAGKKLFTSAVAGIPCVPPYNLRRTLITSSVYFRLLTSP
jgi:hypothetical protein